MYGLGMLDRIYLYKFTQYSAALQETFWENILMILYHIMNFTKHCMRKFWEGGEITVAIF